MSKERRYRLASDPWVVAACGAAMLLRLVRLDAAPLWLDEVFTADVVARSWSGMLTEVLGDNHPPLYFVALKLWGDLAGSSPWVLRLPSVLLSVFAVFLTARLGAVLGGASVARGAAWLAAVSPMLLHHAQEARMYPLIAALAALHLLMLAEFVLGRRPSLGAGFVATAFGLALAHYYTIFLLASSLMILAILRPRPWRSWVPAALGVLAAVGASVLQALLLARHSGGGEYGLGVLAIPGTVWSMISGYMFLPTSEELHLGGLRAAAPYVAVALPAALVVAALVSHGLRALEARARLLLLLPVAGVVLGPYVVRLVLGVGINPRYATTAVPALLVLLAAGAMAPDRRAGRSFAVAVLVGTMALGSALHLREPGHGREDVRAAEMWLDQHVPADEEILITSREMEYVAAFHWPNRRLRLYPPTNVVAEPDTAGTLAAALPFPATGERAIYVVGRAWKSDPEGVFQAELARRYAACPGTSVAGMRILCLRRPRQSLERAAAAH